MTPTLTITDDIAFLTLGEDENRFTPECLEQINAHLDQAEKSAGGLVTVGSGKFYSNGLDLEWLLVNGDKHEWYVGQVHQLFARVLAFPLPTVAAVNGHAFGAGSMLAIAHYFRVMREDRGYLCFPEVDIKIPFTPGMSALIQAKTTPQTAVASMTTGHRFPGPEAQAAGLADATAAEQEVVNAARARIQPLVGKDSATLATIKATMYAGALAALRG